MAMTVLIGDLEGSKQILKRREFQRNLHHVVEALNNSPSRDSLASPFTVTLGDELQAVYQDPTRIIRDCWKLSRFLYPHKLRVAIGLGEIVTDLNPREAIGMDGSAFHVARRVMERELKPRKHRLGIGSDSADVALVDAAAQLLSGWTDQFSATRWGVLDGLTIGQSRKDLSFELNISEAAISKNITAGMIDRVIYLGDEIGRKLSEIARNPN